MTLTTHVAIGAGIGVLVGNPVLGFTLGVISHFLVDMIPHGDTALVDRFYVQKERLIPVAYTTTDAVVAVILLVFLGVIKPDSVSTIPFAMAVTGSVLPDLIVGVVDIFHRSKIGRAYYNFHFFFHDYFSRTYGDVNLKAAIAAQAVFVIIVVKLIQSIN
jgi:hypothetical protein